MEYVLLRLSAAEGRRELYGLFDGFTLVVRASGLHSKVLQQCISVTSEEILLMCNKTIGPAEKDHHLQLPLIMFQTIFSCLSNKN